MKPVCDSRLQAAIKDRHNLASYAHVALKDETSRRIMIVAVRLLALAGPPAVASATHSDGEGPARKNVAHGTGHFAGLNPLAQTDVTMHVNARSGPFGQHAKGRLFVHRGLPSKLDLRGGVTCIKVVGNQAVVGGRIERSKVPIPLSQLDRHRGHAYTCGRGRGRDCRRGAQLSAWAGARCTGCRLIAPHTHSHEEDA